MRETFIKYAPRILMSHTLLFPHVCVCVLADLRFLHLHFIPLLVFPVFCVRRPAGIKTEAVVTLNLSRPFTEYINS